MTKPTEGPLVIIGGHEDREGDRKILKEVARRVGKGKLVLATIASREPEGTLEKYQSALGDLGVQDVRELYLGDREEAFGQDALAALEGAAAVFFSGGDQLRITSHLGGTPLLDRILDISRKGGLIAGTSAGASVLSGTMIVSGPQDETYRDSELNMAPGLGLLPEAIIDQHFAQRGRIARLVGAVAHNPSHLGIGIDEDTAVIVEDGHFKVCGSGAVYILDASAVTRCNVANLGEDQALSVHGLKLHVLAEGDRFDLTTRQPKPAPSRQEKDDA